MAAHTAMSQGNNPQLRSSLENSIGILHFVSPREHSWRGVIRKRFTDFLVNEITEDGEVVHLKEVFNNVREYERNEAAKHPPAELPVPTSSSTSPVPTKVAAEGATGSDAQPKAILHSDGIEKAVTDIAQGASDRQGGETNGTGQHPQAGHPIPAADAKLSDQEIPATDIAILTALLDEDLTRSLVALDKSIRADPKARPTVHGLVKFPPVSDRQTRTKIHSEIRRIFSAKIDTETNADGIIEAKARSSGNKQWGTRSKNQTANQIGPGKTNQKVGAFLHFSLYKENKDTMEAINHLAGVLGMKPQFFSTAGTKDRRAVTVQRVSIRGKDPKKILYVNNKLFGIKIGDFQYSKKGLFLGSHNGNEFTIVMKDCEFQGIEDEPFEHKLSLAETIVQAAAADLTRNDFINYFGTQRFGTFDIGTHTIGMKILQGDYSGAIQDLLVFDPEIAAMDPTANQDKGKTRNDDIYRAKALSKYKTTGDAEEAAKALPRRCNTEFAILKHLGKQTNDFHGAILAITRNMRNMYLHAYQSLVWNFAASKRWELYGAKVIKGDLVSVTEQDVKAEGDAEDDEENIHRTGEDSGDSFWRSVRILSAEDVASGRYSISDIVLPTPGTKVMYPDNKIGTYYRDFMAREENGGLDPDNMQRAQPNFSLTGDYRKFMGSFISSPVASTRGYAHDHDQLIPTDLDLIQARRAKAASNAADTTGAAISGWTKFSASVEEDERKQARQNVAVAQRRKAESPNDDTAEAVVNETWVRTSLAGGNKRVKVAAQSTGINSSTETGQTGVAMEIDESAPVSGEVTAQAGLGTDSVEHDAINGITAPETSSSHTQLEHNNQLTSTGTTRSDAAITAETTQLDKAMTKDTTEPDETVTAETTDLDEANTTKTVKEGEEQKIAVILKFSLPPSAYATVVLRELQG